MEKFIFNCYCVVVMIITSVSERLREGGIFKLISMPPCSSLIELVLQLLFQEWVVNVYITSFRRSEAI